MTELRIHGNTELRNHGIKELRSYGITDNCHIEFRPTATSGHKNDGNCLSSEKKFVSL